MSEPTVDTNVQTTVTEPATTPTAAVNTPPQAATVDIESLNRIAENRAERAAQAAVRDTLKQQGFDDEAIKEMVADWKSKKKTPEQVLAEKEAALQAAEQEKSTLETKIAVMSKGIPAEDVDDYLAMAKVRMDKGEADSLEKALDIVIQKKPLQQQNGGAGFSDKQPPGKSTFESAWGD